MDLFNCRKAEGQLFSDFVADIRAKANRAKADRANLHELTPNDVAVLIYITGRKDAKLRRKSLKEKEPTLAAFNELIQQHKAEAITEKSMAPIHKEEV